MCFETYENLRISGICVCEPSLGFSRKFVAFEDLSIRVEFFFLKLFTGIYLSGRFHFNTLLRFVTNWFALFYYYFHYIFISTETSLCVSFTLLEALIILLLQQPEPVSVINFLRFLSVSCSSKKMDSSHCFASGKSSSVLPKLTFKNVDNKFWGEKIKSNGFFKRLNSNQFGNRKFKHGGVVYAVATSKNPNEAMVC